MMHAIESKISTYETPIIFLDIDGVLNCQLFFKDRHSKKLLRKHVKRDEITGDEFYAEQICTERVQLLNTLCKDTDAKVVISSTWRKNKTVAHLQSILRERGAAFEIIDKTCNLNISHARGLEIRMWLDENVSQMPHLANYVIFDDDSDMLLEQASRFIKTDNYSGLTESSVYRAQHILNAHKL